MDEADTKSMEETVAVVGNHVFRAKLAILIVKPAMYALQGLAMMAFYAISLYGGTWVVVLALRHAKVLHG